MSPRGKWSAAMMGQSAGRALPLPKSRVLVDFVSRAARKWRVIFSVRTTVVWISWRRISAATRVEADSMCPVLIISKPHFFEQ